MLLDIVESYLIGRGYRDIITLRSNRLNEKTPTRDTQINIRVICSKDWKYFRLLVREIKGEGQERIKEPFRIIRSAEIPQEEYESFQEVYRPGMRVQAKQGIVDGEKCDKCGSPMHMKTGSLGKFLSCINYPKCKGSRDYHEPEKRRSKGGLLDPDKFMFKYEK
jgi:hypothetical protein